MTFNIYVPSYGRSGAIITKHHLEYCTYVVRKSEEQAYRDAGVENVLAVEDQEINSLQKVMNWIIEKTPEDVVAVLDDDLESISFRLETIEKFNPEWLTSELERLGQVLHDLDLGYLANADDTSPLYYDRPFKFSGGTGAIRIFNKPALKTRWGEMMFLSDLDFELEELLRNRIMLIPNFLCTHGLIDTNEGGNNGTKTKAMFDAEDELLKLKWGKYYQRSNSKGIGGIKVPR